MSFYDDGPKALPTFYQGIEFRSRLEARWAAFMNAAGIPWEYERGAVQLGESRRCLDFWLPNQGVWMEIKPGAMVREMDGDGFIAMASSHGVSRATGRRALVIFGDPFPGKYHAGYVDGELPQDFYGLSLEDGQGHKCDCGLSFCNWLAPCRFCDGLYLVYGCHQDMQYRSSRMVGPHACAEWKMPLDWPRSIYKKAATAIREATQGGKRSKRVRA